MFEHELVEKILDRFEGSVRQNERLTVENIRQRDELYDLRVEKTRPLARAIIPLLALMLTDPKNRIGQIKELRRAFDLPLKEAKEVLDEVRTFAEKDDIPF